VDRYAGDGFLATFGVPQAHEDDPTRALLAALDMQRTMQKLQVQAFASLGWETQLRVGVNVGAAISGHLDTGLLHDTSVFGHSVNLASRLQEAARPGTILVSEAIYRRCRGNFAFSDPIKLQLKGIDRPVVGYELVTRRAPSHHETRVPFIGRTMHYEVLVEALQHVKTDGRGITVLVTGEPGVGKSRLVAETLAPLEEHFQIVPAECSPTEGRSYSVIAQLLAGLAGADPYDSLEARQRALDELLVGSPIAEVGPFLHVLLSGEDTRTSGRESGSPPDTVRSAVRLLLAWQARRRAPLFVVDDLQWSDTASLQILASVTNLIREVAGALIIIARAEFRPRLAKVFGEHEPLHLELDPLPVAETDELLAALLEGCTVPHALRQELVTRSAGIPLLLTELVRMLADAGVFREGETDPHWHKVVQGVPDSVNGLILSRYDQLPTDAKALLEAAAVLGPWFTPTQLADITSASEKEVGQQLEVLETDNFVRGSSRAGATRYYFQHTLLREAIYETLLLDERRALHGRAAEILQRTEPDVSAALIGHHLERAGSADAAAFLKQAGEQAAACFANEEAEGFYRRAQALLEPPNMTTPEEHVDLALRLADLMLHTGQLEAAEEQLTKAADFNHRAGDIFFYTGQLKTLQGAYDEALAAFQATRSALADAPHTCRAFDIADLERETGWIAYHQGAFTSAKHYAERALGYAQQSANTAGVASAYNLLTPALYWAGELEAAAESGRQALELRERMGDIWGAARTQNNLGHILHRLGKWAEAEAYLRQALFVQREIGDRQGELLSLNNLGLLLTEAGRVLEALEQLDHAIRYLKSGEFAPAIQCQLHINRALAFLLDGQAQAAFADLQVSLATTEEGDNTDIRALTEAYLAEAQLAVGDIEDAWDSYERSQQLAGAHAPREVRAELLTVNAHLLRTNGDLHGALNACRAARAIVDELGSHYEYARLQVETAEIQLALGEAPDEALVRDALRTLQALPARADVARAEGVLLQLGVPGDRAWPTVVVHLKPELDGAVEEDTQDQETLVTA
ncbi:MAG: AAA family ATPase, partial [Anaerolineales bacterium]